MESEMGRKVKWCLIWGTGGFLLLVGVILGALWPTIFFLLLKDEVILTPDSKSFKLWKETPLPLYMDFYMFNWTNPEGVMKNRELPHFVEMGPYVFREFHTKVNMTWNKNGTITFQQVRKWQFMQELSQGKLTDQVTNINVVAMTILAMIKKYVPKQMLPLVEEFLAKEEGVYVTKSVGELLFDGYSDPLLSIMYKLKRVIKKIDIPFDKFGWFYGRNLSSTYDGIFNMYTGADDVKMLGNLYAWNYTTQTKYFPGKCGHIDGTTGELWPLDSAQQDSANIFASDICSSLLLTEREPGFVMNGLVGTKFSANESMFGGESCYCVSGKCQPPGVREISTCRYGAPAFVSLPHFYLADPSFSRKVSGMAPSKEKHEFVIVLQEDTGIPVQVNARLQVNILSEPHNNFLLFSNLPKAMMPMLWFDQHAKITDVLGSQIDKMAKANEFARPVLFSVAGVGALIMAVGVVLWVKQRQQSLDTEELIPSAST